VRGKEKGWGQNGNRDLGEKRLYTDPREEFVRGAIRVSIFLEDTARDGDSRLRKGGEDKWESHRPRLAISPLLLPSHHSADRRGGKRGKGKIIGG